MFKIEFYVPQSHLEIVKDALFNSGAGQIGDYEKCCWQILGEGQFQPNSISNPFSGKRGELERLSEWKVEMICHEDRIKKALNALLGNHPYEEPAYNIVKIYDKSMFL